MTSGMREEGSGRRGRECPRGGLGGSEADTQSPLPLNGRGRDDEGCDGRSEGPSEDLPLLHGRWGEHRRCGGIGQARRDPLFTSGGL